MSRPRFLAFVLMLLAVALTGSEVRGGMHFFDDFEDGNIDDNSPVSWRTLHDGGQFRAVDGALELRPDANSEVSIVAHSYGYDKEAYLISLVVTLQFSEGGDDFSAGLISRSTDDGAYKLSLSRAGMLSLSYGEHSLAQAQLAFDPVREPVTLRLDQIGNGSMAYAWTGATPNYWEDFVFTNINSYSWWGGVGVFAESTSTDSGSFVRFEKFRATPEPSAQVIGILTALGLLSTCRIWRAAHRQS